jgi:hypothetical protein
LCCQALELGYWLRQQYIDSVGFLPASYKPGQGGCSITAAAAAAAAAAAVHHQLHQGCHQQQQQQWVGVAI